jgi:hypothetical protein
MTATIPDIPESSIPVSGEIALSRIMARDAQVLRARREHRDPDARPVGRPKKPDAEKAIANPHYSRDMKRAQRARKSATGRASAQPPAVVPHGNKPEGKRSHG